MVVIVSRLTSHTDDVLICTIDNLRCDLDKENSNMKKSRAKTEVRLKRGRLKLFSIWKKVIWHMIGHLPGMFPLN